MRYIDRNYCVYSGTSDLVPLTSFPKFPVFMGCVDTPPEEDLLEDMNWFISRSTGSLQLNPLLPLNVVYPEQHNEAVGGLWLQHHRDFAKYVARLGLQQVLEIGAAHGLLAKEYQDLVPDVQWTILEPNPKIVEGVRARVIRGFFDDDFRFSGPLDAVVHSHVFEHVYFPDKFMATLARFMTPGKTLMFSIPNMMAQLTSCYTNCLNFEHTYFITEPLVEYLLARHGFRITDRTYFSEHSIFFTALREAKPSRSPIMPQYYDRHRELFERFINYHLGIVRELNDRIRQSRKPVYLFGAHIFSQYLLNFGLETERIVCVLDNAVGKIGRRLYGTKLRVESPKVLENMGEAAVILKAGAYNQEIRDGIVNHINRRVEFWE